MKKILLGLLILVSFNSNAQETEFTFTDDKGMTDFIVTPVEGKTAPEIYKKIVDWIKITYTNPDEVILSTIENEYVRFEGTTNEIDKTKSKYQIEISIKDGKYKFDLINLLYYDRTIQMYGVVGWTNYYGNFISNSTKESRKDKYKKDGSYKVWWRNTPVEVPAFFNKLNKSLSESIVSTIKKGDGW
jgi:hypothetical protein